MGRRGSLRTGGAERPVHGGPGWDGRRTGERADERTGERDGRRTGERSAGAPLASGGPLSAVTGPPPRVAVVVSSLSGLPAAAAGMIR
jgi:hypothetical protein